jgi:hypothetical protein
MRHTTADICKALRQVIRLIAGEARAMQPVLVPDATLRDGEVAAWGEPMGAAFKENMHGCA